MSDTLTVITNNKPRELVTWHELPASARGWFDYLDEDQRYDARLFNYRGSWYDANEFTIAPADMRPWEGISRDSFFSGVLIRYPREDYGQYGSDVDYEHVIVGRYYA